MYFSTTAMSICGCKRGQGFERVDTRACLRLQFDPFFPIFSLQLWVFIESMIVVPCPKQGAAGSWPGALLDIIRVPHAHNVTPGGTYTVPLLFFHWLPPPIDPHPRCCVKEIVSWLSKRTQLWPALPVLFAEILTKKTVSIAHPAARKTVAEIVTIPTT